MSTNIIIIAIKRLNEILRDKTISMNVRHHALSAKISLELLNEALCNQPSPDNT
jgi:hypothetical protein